jgi:hypothetical protein
MSDEPAEREIMPGVFLTDFRHSSSPTDPSSISSSDSSLSFQDVFNQALASQLNLMPNATTESKQADESASLPDEVSLLALEYQSLTVSIGQLKQSNDIMREEISKTISLIQVAENKEPSSTSSDSPSLSSLQEDLQIYEEAVAENEVVIAKRAHRHDALKNFLESHFPHAIPSLSTNNNSTNTDQIDEDDEGDDEVEDEDDEQEEENTENIEEEGIFL